MLTVVHLPVDALVPNPWNPNRMDDTMRAKVRAYVQQEGLVQPLVVRVCPDDSALYQILGGYHRWLICKEDLGYTEVPCVVVDVDDRRAKVLTVNLNDLGGQSVPHLLAELVHDLHRDTSLDDLATLLPYDSRELADSLELLKLPAGLDLQLEAEAAAHADGAPKMLTFLVDEAEPVNAAIERLAGTLRGRTDGAGRWSPSAASTWSAFPPRLQLRLRSTSKHRSAQNVYSAK